MLPLLLFSTRPLLLRELLPRPVPRSGGASVGGLPSTPLLPPPPPPPPPPSACGDGGGDPPGGTRLLPLPPARKRPGFLLLDESSFGFIPSLSWQNDRVFPSTNDSIVPETARVSAFFLSIHEFAPNIEVIEPVIRSIPEPSGDIRRF